MNIYRTPSIIKAIFPGLVWDFRNNGKNIYLTFDDGPNPGITEYVLDVLEKLNARATFFCVGQNVESNPLIFHQIWEQGHTIGNHTYNHLNGWNTSNKHYFGNIRMCEEVFKENGYNPGIKYFRPPYGKMKLKQIDTIKHEYKIIMWDLLSMDFKSKQSPERCLDLTKKYSKPGSIIVFHDSLKTKNKIKFVLERLLDFLKEQGFHFCSIEEYFTKEKC